MTISSFYVKEGGLAVDDAGREPFGSERSGPFEADANNFPSILAALNTSGVAPIGGDRFICAHDSDEIPYSTNTILAAPTGAGAPLEIISVDEQNQDVAKAGFKEGFSGATDLTYIGNWVGSGYSPGCGDELKFANVVANLILQNGTINFANEGDRITMDQNGASLTLINMILDYPLATTSTTGIRLNDNATFHMYKGAITSSITGTIPFLVSGLAAAAGFNALFKGVDLSIVIDSLLGDVGGVVGDDNFIMVVDGCTLNGSLTSFVEENFIYPGQEMLVTRSSAIPAAAEHQYFYRNYRGDVKDNTVTTRSASATFPNSNQKVSLEVTPDALCTRLSAFRFQIPEAFVALSNPGKNKLRFFVTCGVELTDADIWAEVYYPDFDNNNVYNAVSGALQLPNSYTIDPLGDGNVLETDASWTNPLAFEQIFEADTVVNKGSDSIPIVYINVATTAPLFIDLIYNSVAS